MSIFNFLKPKRGLTHAERQWNRMWALWSEGRVPSPYRELMHYQAEVNNGGHGQYFANTADNGDLNAEVAALLPILPLPHAENLRRAYDIYLAGGEEETCDDVFCTNEESINDLLRAYADTIVL